MNGGDDDLDDQCEDNRDDTQVRTGRIILWTPQLLSTEILTSSTNSRCTTPLHTLGGDFVWKTIHLYFTSFFHSKFIPENSYRVGLTAEGYDADRVQVAWALLSKIVLKQRLSKDGGLWEAWWENDGGGDQQAHGTPINVVRFPNPLDSVGEPDYNVLVTKTSTSSVSLTALWYQPPGSASASPLGRGGKKFWKNRNRASICPLFSLVAV